MFHPHTRTILIALTLALAPVGAATADAKSRGAQRPAVQILCGPAFAPMTGAELLDALRAQTGGGRLAVINDRSYVRYPDGTRAVIAPCSPTA
jgi:hypothetical protein